MPNGNSFIEEYLGGLTGADFLSQWLGYDVPLQSSGSPILNVQDLQGLDNPFVNWILSGASEGPTGQLSNMQDLYNIASNLSGYIEENPLYQYQGVPATVMDALGNVFGGLEGYEIGLDDIFGEEGFGDVPETLFTNILSDNIFGYDVTDADSIAQGLSAAAFGGDYNPDEHIRAAEVRALTPEQLKKTTGAYYEPYETTERGNLIDKLSKEIGKVGTGGFAGSGARASGLSGAEQLYRGGYSDILKDIMKLKSRATEDVLDTIYGWQELLSEQ